MAHTIALSGIVDLPSVGTAEVLSIALNDFQQLLYVDDMAGVFFNEDTDTISINYYHSSLGRWVPYTVIYDDPHTSANIGAGYEFNTLRPQFQVPESILSHRILKKDRCVLKGVEYRIDDFISDGVGITTVYLRLS
jgi:hypothetical protein